MKCATRGATRFPSSARLRPVKWLAAALLGVLMLLQYRLWLSASGVQELARLAGAVAQQQGEDEPQGKPDPVLTAAPASSFILHMSIVLARS